MEKKQTLYEITDDLKALSSLMENLVDENGDPREPTAEEFETMKQWFMEGEASFKNKFDNYCKFIKNLKRSADKDGARLPFINVHQPTALVIR